MDRRAIFFLGAAVLCLIALVITPDELRWVGISLVVLYTVLALASHLDYRSRTRERR